MAERYRAALAFGYIAAVLILITGALLWIIMDPAVDKISTLVSAKITDPAAQNHHDTMIAVWTRFAFYIMFVGLVGLLARAYFESEVTP